MANVCEDYTLKNTSKNTAWAVRIFTEWQCQRGEGDCPPHLLEAGSANQLNHWLSRLSLKRVWSVPIE